MTLLDLMKRESVSKINESLIKDILESKSDAIVSLIADQLLEEIINQTGLASQTGLVDSGGYKSKHQKRQIEKAHYQIFNNSLTENGESLAAIIEFGTEPHFILPKKPDGVLAFDSPAASDIKTRRLLYRNRKTEKLQKSKSKNTTIFAKWVAHPGTRPYAVFQKAINFMRVRSILGSKL